MYSEVDVVGGRKEIILFTLRLKLFCARRVYQHTKALGIVLTLPHIYTAALVSGAHPGNIQ